MKISFITITARIDYPYTTSKHHLFQPTYECLNNQTDHDFEWIIIDALYKYRKNYFKNKQTPYTVKHIPAQPNIWHEHGFPGISTQYNKGIIYSDGELLFFTGDSYMPPPNFMKKLWKYYNHAYFPLAWYMREYHKNKTTNGPDGDTPQEPSEKTPTPYNLCGYNGINVAIEHRYKTAFQKTLKNIHEATWEWWFGCSSANIQSMLKINGFDQNFDGDYTLLDCDVGSRLALTGYDYFALFRDLYLVRLPSKTTYWSSKIQKNQKVAIKCNYGLLWLNRIFKKIKANTTPLTKDELNWIQQTYCKNQCTIRQKCETDYNHQYPFINRNAKVEYKTWLKLIKNNQIDLAEEREQRIDNKEKYREGIIKWVQ